MTEQGCSAERHAGSSGMKVVVQDPATLAYFSGDGVAWTADIEKARTFPNTVAALAEGTRLKQPFQIVLHFDDNDPRFDITLPPHKVISGDGE